MSVMLLALNLPSLANGNEVTPRTSRAVHTEGMESSARALRFDRRQWDLSQREWARYQNLMRGIRGSLSPATLSPIEVLGVHARDDAERLGYARRWARLMHADAERILEFQRAYQAAWHEMDPNGVLIDLNAIASARGGLPIRKGDRVLLFLALSGCSACSAALAGARQATESVDAQLDIYVTDSTPGVGDSVIQRWARQQGFKLARLKVGKVTFNHDNGVMNRYAGAAATVPLALRVRADRIEAIDLRRIGG